MASLTIPIITYVHGIKIHIQEIHPGKPTTYPLPYERICYMNMISCTCLE